MRLILLLLILPIGSGSFVREPSAMTNDRSQLQVSEDSAGVHLTVMGADTTTWPSVAVHGLSIPAQLVVVAHDDATPPEPVISDFDCRPWSGNLTPGERPQPQANGHIRPDLAPQEIRQLSTSPLTLLREGRSHGQRIVVLAVVSILEHDGRPCRLTRLDATIPGAYVLNDPSDIRTTGKISSTSTAPVNAAAGRLALLIHVRDRGMQRLSGAAIGQFEGEHSSVDPVRLHLYRQGQEIPLQLLGAEDGRLDPADELRFYAPEPGDRWNETDSYWLVVEDAPGRRMTVRDGRSGSAPLRTTAETTGNWQPRTIYDSTLPGPDRDHWFAADLRTGPGQAAAQITVPLTPTLPLASGPLSLTITGSAYTAGTHQLEIRAGMATTQRQWQGTGNWTHTITLDTDSTSAQVTLLPGSTPDGIEIDAVQWTRPIMLDISNTGTTFGGVAGTWRYELHGITSDQTLYDVTDPTQPVRLIPGGNVFQDSLEQRHYLVTGSSTLHTPEVTSHRPIDLLTPRNADAVYVAPAPFRPALLPLMAHRREQGYAVELIDVEDIYAIWSFGQVAPEAIRRFMQHAAATWPNSPESLILVGDGTSDPHNFTGRNNLNHIPPYLALVDPWLGETACEPCFGQLDGDDALADALPDLAVGRLPVKSEAELTMLVQKLIRYDTSAAGGSWRGKVVYVADNADSAGNFANFAELSVTEQPENMAVERVYYAPSPQAEPVPGGIRDAREARARTLAALNAGAGLVNYVGHSHTWQWAVTDPAVTPAYLLGLYDVDTLTNGDRLPIVLEMTCLTSAFQQPAYSGTTIDERLVVHPTGGAIATWGPTGLGIAHGHDALQRGFYRALWSRPGGTATLGDLTLAGYQELFMRGTCCQDTLRTFTLLGDPLTKARVQPLQQVWLPSVRR